MPRALAGRRSKKPSRVEPRKRARQSRAGATVDAILIASARVLVKEGPRRFNTNRVAEIAGVSVGSLYQYFPGKEALLAALMHRHEEEQQAGFYALVEQAMSRPLDQAIAVFIDQFIEGHLKDLALHAALSRVAVPEGASARRGNVELGVSVVAALLAGHAPRASAEEVGLVAYTAVHLVDAVVHRALVDEPAALASGALAAVLLEAVRGVVATLPS